MRKKWSFHLMKINHVHVATQNTSIYQKSLWINPEKHKNSSLPLMKNIHCCKSMEYHSRFAQDENVYFCRMCFQCCTFWMQTSNVYIHAHIHAKHNMHTFMHTHSSKAQHQNVSKYTHMNPFMPSFMDPLMQCEA